MAVANKEFFPREEEILPQYRVKREINQRQYLINGELRAWQDPVQEVLSPIYIRGAGNTYAQKRLGSVPMLDGNEAMSALDSADKAYDEGDGFWSSLPVKERLGYINRFLDRMAESRDEIVNLLMWEIAKPLKDSQKEFDRTIDYARATVAKLEELNKDSSKFAIVEGMRGKIKRAPLGTVLCMGPFNYPLNETYTTLIPALAMGNTIIFKPAKAGVLLHEPLLKAYQECFPPGVINTIYGDGEQVINPIMKDGRIDALAFIGSTKVSKIIRNNHPDPHSLRCILGLGAKNPMIFYRDCDMKLAVKKGGIQAMLSYNGQRCTAGKIGFLDEPIVDEFLARLADEVDNLVCGMPWEDNVFNTPLAEKANLERQAQLIEDATSQGARIINKNGGQINHSFVSPTILYPVTPKMRIYHEEQFGPVLAFTSYKSIDEPIEYVKKSRLRQQAGIFGQDPHVMGKLIDSLTSKVCRVNLNGQCQRGPDVWPFTGRKDSAERSLSVEGALYEFSMDSVFGAEDTEYNNRILEEILRTGSSQFLSE
jgi:glyceraldehyde-3-phosphate dehydrogenase (NADP+)